MTEQRRKHMEPIKHRVTHYWSHRAEAFQTQRIREFENEKHERWLQELCRYIPQGRPLRVLDLGTGTGFFAFVFAAEGHEATGIDQAGSENYITGSVATGMGCNGYNSLIVEVTKYDGEPIPEDAEIPQTILF